MKPKPPHSHPEGELPSSLEAVKPEIATLDQFLKLQEHQADYLEWLKASEKKLDIDQYTYRKIR